MNILIVNWSWYPSGGDWTYINTIKKIYEENGHKVIPFSVRNANNESTEYEKYFLDALDYKVLNKNKSLSNSISVIFRSVYSFEAKKKLKKLLRENKVDIAQFISINNYQTPSIIPILKKNKIPIIWRLVDYKLICPNTTFLSGGSICEACKIGKYYNCIIKKCKKNSILASIIAAAESYFYKYYDVYNLVDLFSFQSAFTRDKYVEFGFDYNKTFIMKNPVEYVHLTPDYRNTNFVLYFGRIEKYKGIYTLLNAMNDLPEIELRIIGDGPELFECKKLTDDLSLTNIKFLGSLWSKELEKHLLMCNFVVVPSEWYEPNPYSILQSFAAGKAVIGSRIGGIKDLIIDNENGLFFEAGDVVSLSTKIRSLFFDKAKTLEFGMNARKTIEQNHSKIKYYNDSMKIFEKLSERSR